MVLAFGPATGSVEVNNAGNSNASIDATNGNNDEIESYISDFDQPYYETACDWYVRATTRRAHCLAGVSSSSSSDECSGLESEDEFQETKFEGGSKRKAMDKAAWSVNKPLTKYLASYPLVAARCCLSVMSSTTFTMTPDTPNGHGTKKLNRLCSPYTARERETKKLRHMLRKLSRKQKELLVKFTKNDNSAEKNGRSSYYNSVMLQINQVSRETTGHDHSVIHSLLPEGTRISFLDAVLTRASLQSKPVRESYGNEELDFFRLVLELNGPSRSGMTSILLAVAARYVASTSNIFLDTQCTVGSHGDHTSGPTSHPAHKTWPAYPTVSVNEPHVVILDLEKGIHVSKLIFSIREAVARRWEETAVAREWKREQESQSNLNKDGKDTAQEHVDTPAKVDEQHQLELAIVSCLSRIHLVQPRDFTYLSLIATIEALRQTLDDQRLQQKPKARQQEPPTLILIDSLTTLDESTRFQETLGSNQSSGSSGLSDRNEFYRQLIRLREEHEIIILGTSRSAPSRAKQGKKWDSNSLWDKMVSHRIFVHRAAQGTCEDRAGYAFVATLNLNDKEGTRVFPYSVTAGGIFS